MNKLVTYENNVGSIVSGTYKTLLEEIRDDWVSYFNVDSSIENRKEIEDTIGKLYIIDDCLEVLGRNEFNDEDIDFIQERMESDGYRKIRDFREVEWFPVVGEVYWFNYNDGDIDAHRYTGCSVDQAILERHKPCQTEQEAIFEDNKQVFLRFMEKEFKNNSEKINWSDKTQPKYKPIYNYSGYRIEHATYSFVDNGGLHTTNLRWLSKFIDDYTKSIEKYYFEIQEEENE